MQAPVDRKISLKFGWQGPKLVNGGPFKGGLSVEVVDLHFKNAKTEISVNIPDDLVSSTLQKLPFTCRKYQETEVEIRGRRFKPLLKEDHPDTLKVTIEQIQNLQIKAGFFEKSSGSSCGIMNESGQVTYEERLLRINDTIKLEIPKDLEVGQTYSLIITSSPHLSLSARLVKENNPTPKELPREDFQRRMRNMGEALIDEGLQNLHLASQGGIGAFNYCPTTADIYAHGMQGIVRAGQEMVPEIQVPYTRPEESPSDLDKLPVNELQSRFEATFIRDKKLELERLQAAAACNIEELNRIIKEEHANSQLLIHLAEALERKGVKAQIPQSQDFQSATAQSAQAQAEMLKALEETCKQQ